MGTKITQDALQLISSYLTPTSRFNMAEIDDECFEEASKWRDVRTLVVDDDELTMGSPNMVHRFNGSIDVKKEEDSRINSINTAFDICPSLRRLIIQTRLREKDVKMLSGNPLRIGKLYISTENLTLPELPLFDRLRTLHIVANNCIELRVMNVVGDHVLKSLFPATLRRVCLTDIYLTDNLMKKLQSLPKLQSLDMIGCLVDSNVACSNFIPIIEKMTELEELSLPPSFYSFTTKSKSVPNVSLKKTNIEKLSIYMDSFDKEYFETNLVQFAPKRLKILVLFGNYIPLKRQGLKLKEYSKLTIIYGPNYSIATCPQENLNNVKLLSHLVRRPPYTLNPNLMLLQSFVDFPIENLSWKFSLAEWQANDQPPPPSSPHLVGRGRAIARTGPLAPPPLGGARMQNARSNNNNNNNNSTAQRRRGSRPLAASTPRQVTISERTQQSARSDSMRTQPPSPIVPNTNNTNTTNNNSQSQATTPIITEIPANTSVISNTGPNTSTRSELNRAFVTTPPAEPDRGARIEPDNEGFVMVADFLSQIVDAVIERDPATANATANPTVQPPNGTQQQNNNQANRTGRPDNQNNN